MHYSGFLISRHLIWCRLATIKNLFLYSMLLGNLRIHILFN